MKLFVFGLGYTAIRFLELYGNRFEAIAGTVRIEAKKAALHAQGYDAFRFDQEATDPQVAERFAEADYLLVSVPAPSGIDPVLAAFPELLSNKPDARIVYLSSIGVYADHAGNWIDETAPLIESADRRGARIRAEQAWIAAAGHRLRILRLAGIYGPGRNALERLQAGTARRIVKPGQVTNRIHVDDAARAIAAALDHPDGGVWNVCDDEPAPPQDVITYAAKLMGIEPPPEEDFATADMTPMARSFYATSNRVRNARLKAELGITLAYPTYREGLKPLRAIN